MVSRELVIVIDSNTLVGLLRPTSGHRVSTRHQPNLFLNPTISPYKSISFKMTSESLPRRTERKRSTLLPPYSLHPPIASIKNAAALVTQLLPVRAFSTDSEATLDPSPILTSTGRIIGDLPIPITEEPEDSTSGLPPPPHYFGSTKPVLLWLGEAVNFAVLIGYSFYSADGGGTKIMIEAYFLGNILRRLAWDLKYINSRSSTPQYEIPPKDCFDWVGGSGCGTYVVHL